MKIFTAFFVSMFSLAFLVSPIAAQVETQEFSIPTLYTQESDMQETIGSKVSESIYGFKDSMLISQPVVNDVVYAGEDLVINAAVTDNVIFAGGSLEINGDVSGDILFFGGALIVNGNVAGDIRAAGGTVVINSASINGDLLVVGSTVLVSSGTTIDGVRNASGTSVDTNAIANPTNMMTLQEKYGNYGDKLAETFAGLGLGFATFGLIMQFIIVIGSIFTSYLIIRLFPQFSEKTISTIMKNPGKSVISGFITLVIGFFGAFLLIFSIIGLHTLFVGLVFFIIASILASVYAQYSVGKFIVNRVHKGHSGRFVSVVVGIVVVELSLLILYSVPVIGWNVATLVEILLFALGLGAIVYNKYEALKR